MGIRQLHQLVSFRPVSLGVKEYSAENFLFLELKTILPLISFCEFVNVNTET